MVGCHGVRGAPVWYSLQVPLQRKPEAADVGMAGGQLAAGAAVRVGLVLLVVLAIGQLAPMSHQ